MSITTDLITACVNGDLRKAKALHKRGAHIYAGTDYALRWAARIGHLDVVKYLVEQGADIHAWKDEALKWAAAEGRLDIVNFLREVAGPRYKCRRCLIKSTCLKLCEDFRPGEG